MKTKTLKHWKGALNILVSVATPFGLWATGQTTLLGAGVGGVIGGLTATLNWVDQSLADAEQKRQGREASKLVAAPTAPLELSKSAGKE